MEILNLIKNQLYSIISAIDTGNSNITEEEAIELIKVIQSYTDRDQKLSKYQACQYLNISRASFDNYVKAGILPKGKKEAGFKELFYTKKDLDNFKERRANERKYKE